MAVKKFRPSTFQRVATVEYNALVTLVNELRTQMAAVRTAVNELKADHNATLAKLDADAGVTDTNYAATNAVSATDVAATSAAAANTLAKTY